MNTIKEQATVNVTAKDAKSYEIGFDTGANYVLEQITEAIRLCDNDRNTDLYSALWDCIDKLRK